MKTLILSTIAILASTAFIFGQEKEVKKEVKIVKEVIQSDSIEKGKKEINVISTKESEDGSGKVVIISKTKNGKIVEQQLNISGDEEIDISKLIDSILNESIGDIDINVSGASKIKVLTNSDGEDDGQWFNKEGNNWIDIEDIKEIEEIKMMDSKRPFLGVILDDEIELEEGIRVINVIEKSAAEKAGIEKNDIIISINNNKINSLKDLVAELSDKEIGDQIALQIRRNKELKGVNAKLQSKSESKYNLSNSFQFKTPACCSKSNGKCCPHHSRTYKALMHQSKPKLGVYIENLDAEMINDLKIKEEKGVLITKVLEETTAKKMGLKVNDVITKINDSAIGDVASLNDFLAKQKLGDEIEVSYYRYGKVKKAQGVLFEFNHSNMMDFDWIEKE